MGQKVPRTCSSQGHAEGVRAREGRWAARAYRIRAEADRRMTSNDRVDAFDEPLLRDVESHASCEHLWRGAIKKLGSDDSKLARKEFGHTGEDKDVCTL